jgi:hypothetical protein
MKTNPTNPSIVIKKTTIQVPCPKNSIPNKWDKCLDDYYNYLKEYIKHYKKSLKGNLVSLAQYPYMQARSETVFEQLNNAQNKGLLTEKQVKRILKIQIKTLYKCCA